MEELCAARAVLLWRAVLSACATAAVIFSTCSAVLCGDCICVCPSRPEWRLQGPLLFLEEASADAL